MGALIKTIHWEWLTIKGISPVLPCCETWRYAGKKWCWQRRWEFYTLVWLSEIPNLAPSSHSSSVKQNQCQGHLPKNGAPYGLWGNIFFKPPHFFFFKTLLYHTRAHRDRHPQDKVVCYLHDLHPCFLPRTTKRNILGISEQVALQSPGSLECLGLRDYCTSWNTWGFIHDIYTLPHIIPDNFLNKFYTHSQFVFLSSSLLWHGAKWQASCTF